MEQRPLRLGDIVDDYCPRERRLTNHAIVAIFEDAIQKTRCTTCDAEHVYKHGREPRRRKKEETLFEQVMADVAGAPRVPTKPVIRSEPEPAQPEPAAATANSEGPTQSAAGESEGAGNPKDEHHPDGWLAHRQLIRAALPKIEGEAPVPRPIPEFTMYQRPQGRGGRPFRFGGGGGGNSSGGERNGNVTHARGAQGGQGNFDGNRGPRRPDGQGQGAGPGPGAGHGRRRRRHKRPR